MMITSLFTPRCLFFGGGGVTGKQICAFVVPVMRAGSSIPLSEEILEAACKWLALYKLPKVIYWIESLPKSRVGKILRRALQGEVASGSATAGGARS